MLHSNLRRNEVVAGLQTGKRLFLCVHLDWNWRPVTAFHPLVVAPRIPPGYGPTAGGQPPAVQIILHPVRTTFARRPGGSPPHKCWGLSVEYSTRQ